jgi:hypothetical protein
MTSDAQREAIKKLIEEHTRNVTTSRRVARESLISEGFYTPDGQLTVQYGGRSSGDSAAK